MCSLKLMRKTLNSYEHRMAWLTEDRLRYKEQLRSDGDIGTWRYLSSVVHQLNKELYFELQEVKVSKLSKIMPHPVNIPEITQKVVIEIPDTVSLLESEEKLISKGLSFVPLTKKNSTFQTLEDAEQFFRKVRLKAHFSVDKDGYIDSFHQ